MVNKLNMSKKNMMWRKEKLEELYFSKNVFGHTHASGSGDGSSIHGGTCCRLCGGDRSLRGINETCLWEGVEKRFDDALFDCFGVQVLPEDCKICAHCINQLMVSYKFKALVQAAFTKTCSNDRKSSSYTLGEKKESMPDDMVESYFGLKNLDDSDQHINQKLIDRLSQKKVHPQKRALKIKAVKISNPPKKIIATCSMCGQKYPSMVIGDVKEFVCSRCKLKLYTTDVKKLNSVLSKDENVKAGFRVKGRLRQLKKPAQVKNSDSPKSFLKQIKAANTIQPYMKPKGLLKTNMKLTATLHHEYLRR